MIECSFMNELAGDSSASSKEFLDIQASIECGLILKLVRDMIRTFSKMQQIDKYLQQLNHMAS